MESSFVPVMGFLAGIIESAMTLEFFGTSLSILIFRLNFRFNDKNVVSVGITRARCWDSLMPINVQFDIFSIFLFRLLELKISIWQLNSKYYNEFILESFLNTMVIWISYMESSLIYGVSE